MCRQDAQTLISEYTALAKNRALNIQFWSKTHPKIYCFCKNHTPFEIGKKQPLNIQKLAKNSHVKTLKYFYIKQENRGVLQFEMIRYFFFILYVFFIIAHFASFE